MVNLRISEKNIKVIIMLETTQEDLTRIMEIAIKIKNDLATEQTDLFGNPIVKWGTAKMMTEMVLDQFPKSRENDDYGIEVFKQLYKANNIPLPRSAAELFRRSRQKFQEKGEYEASPEVKEARGKAAEWVRSNAKYL